MKIYPYENRGGGGGTNLLAILKGGGGHKQHWGGLNAGA